MQATGGSQRDIVGNLSGIAVTKFQDGELRGINVAKMIRALTNGSLAGWQEGQSETTDLTELGASFQIDHGQAQTQDFKLAGPLVRVTGIGTADLNTKAINFRLEPKLVMSIQGQGAGADPVGFGVPVMVQGPWNQPHFFLDMAGILDNPDAAYAQLRQLGQGLFGSNFLQPNGATGNTPNANNPAGNNVMNGIGNLIQGLTGKPNQTPTAGQNAAPQQAPAQGQQAAPAQGQTAQGGAANSGPSACPRARRTKWRDRAAADRRPGSWTTRQRRWFGPDSRPTAEGPARSDHAEPVRIGRIRRIKRLKPLEIDATDPVNRGRPALSAAATKPC